MDNKHQRIKNNAVTLDNVYLHNKQNDIDCQIKTFAYKCYSEKKEASQEEINEFLNEYFNGKETTVKEHITLGRYIAEYIERAKKTGGEVTIPFVPYVRHLIENNDLENVADVADWEINREMKNICRQAGITEKIVKVYTKASKRQTEIMEKWKEVGTHTARRSFATNIYLQKVPSFTIMKITRHKTEIEFLR